VTADWRRRVRSLLRKSIEASQRGVRMLALDPSSPGRADFLHPPLSAASLARICEGATGGSCSADGSPPDSTNRSKRSLILVHSEPCRSQRMGGERLLRVGGLATVGGRSLCCPMEDLVNPKINRVDAATKHRYRRFLKVGPLADHVMDAIKIAMSKKLAIPILEARSWWRRQVNIGNGRLDSDPWRRVVSAGPTFP
jgi:hypothetical protein